MRAGAELTHAHAVAEAASTLAVQVGETAAHLAVLRDDANGVTQTELLVAQAQLAAYEAARDARERYEAERARREAQGPLAGRRRAGAARGAGPAGRPTSCGREPTTTRSSSS